MFRSFTKSELFCSFTEFLFSIIGCSNTAPSLLSGIFFILFCPKVEGRINIIKLSTPLYGGVIGSAYHSVMIIISEHKGIKIINSWELYKKLGLSMKNYRRWLQINIFSIAQLGIDYFEIKEQRHKDLFYSKTPQWKGLRAGKFTPPVYLLTINTAISLCLKAKTKQARQLKFYLRIRGDKNY